MTLPALKAAGRAEFWKIKPETIEGYEDFLDTYADTIYQAAIDACLEALPKENVYEKHERNLAIEEARANVSALNKSL